MNKEPSNPETLLNSERRMLYFFIVCYYVLIYLATVIVLFKTDIFGVVDMPSTGSIILSLVIAAFAVWLFSFLQRAVYNLLMR